MLQFPASFIRAPLPSFMFLLLLWSATVHAVAASDGRIPSWPLDDTSSTAAADNLSVSPDPTLTTKCDLGVSDAPCKPANARIIVVAQDGSGQYTDLKPALDAALPGDTIQIKNGSYTCPSCSGQGGYLLTKSGTKDSPITIMNYPSHAPQLRMTVTIWGEWVLVQGLEITQINGDGIHLNYNLNFAQKARHVTIRGNRIHENGFMGIYTAALSDLLIEHNVFERNGLGPGDCITNWTGGPVSDNYRYAHCHGIYLNNSTGTTSNPTPTTGVTIRRNKFINNAGFGWTNRTDGVRSTNYLIENNLFVNNSLNQGFIDLDHSVIRNNTIVQFTYAHPNDASKTCFYSNHNTQNIIANNVCYAVLAPNVDSLYPIHSWANDSTVDNTWVRNAFFVRSATNWIWSGELVREFLNTYKSTTKDANGLTIPIVAGDGSEAGFVNAQNGDFHLIPTSPLVKAGDPAHCPAVDIEGVPRSSKTCVIGAYTIQ